MNKKTQILFRWSNYNHYTISALMGLLDNRLDPDKFYISTKSSVKDIAEATKSTKGATILAYSFTTPEFNSIANEILQIRSLLRDKIIIICGGSHTTALPQNVLDAGADVAFTGETEESLPRFLNDLSESREVLKERVINPLPLGSFDHYPPFAYKRNFFTPIELRRGCLNRCAFCQTPRIFKEIRQRSIESLKHYIQYMLNDKRDSVFFIIPDALSYGATERNLNIPHLERFLDEIYSMGIKINLGNFPSEVSPRSVAMYPEAAGLLRKYVQNIKIVLGGQNASQNVLDTMARDHTYQDIVDSVKILTSYGFKPILDILFGTPGESRDDRTTTVRAIQQLAEEYKVVANLHYFMALPGTPFADAKPEKLENDIKESIHKLINYGIARGNFFEQMKFSTDRSDPL